MDINLSKEGDSAVFYLAGSVDEKGAEQMKEEFTKFSPGNIKTVKIDFKNVSYIGSSGIGKLLLFYKNMGVRSVKLEVVGVSSLIYDLFAELKLDTIFPISKA